MPAVAAGVESVGRAHAFPQMKANVTMRCRIWLHFGERVCDQLAFDRPAVEPAIVDFTIDLSSSKLFRGRKIDHFGVMMAGKVAPLPIRRALSGLGEDFATWRRLRGLTIAQVAERADVTRGTVSRLEHGAGATLENTLRIARALGILDGLARSADPYASDVGRLRSEEILPQRVRTKRPAAATVVEAAEAEGS